MYNEVIFVLFALIDVASFFENLRANLKNRARIPGAFIDEKLYLISHRLPIAYIIISSFSNPPPTQFSIITFAKLITNTFSHLWQIQFRIVRIRLHFNQKLTSKRTRWPDRLWLNTDTRCTGRMPRRIEKRKWKFLTCGLEVFLSSRLQKETLAFIF